MKCPQCASDNADDAPECAFCRVVMTPAPAAASPAEPAKLGNLESFKALMLTALAALKAGRTEEATRLIARFFTECAPADCEAFVAMSGNIWLDSVALSGERAEVAKKLIGVAAVLVGRGQLADAHGALIKAAELAADRPNPNLMLPLLTLGLGGLAQAGRPQPAEPRNEPATLKTEGDVESLLAAAWGAAREGRFAEGRRLAGRFFIELDLATCASRVQNAGRLWIESVKLAPAQAAVATRLIAAAAELIGREDFAAAVPLLEQAGSFAANAPVQHPAFPVLLMGLKGAVEDAQLLARYKALVDQGMKAMTTPGGKAQAAVCFEQALAILPHSADAEAERRVRSRLEEMLKIAREPDAAA